MRIFEASFLLFFPFLVVNCQSGSSRKIEYERKTADTFLNGTQARECKKNKKLKKFAVYYGIPSLVKEVGKENCGVSQEEEISCAINIFSNFDFVIFGAGLEEEDHYAHNSTMEVIKGSAATLFFGYINLGDLHKEKYYSTVDLQNKITLWKKMGVYGVFIDESGFDFWTQEKSKYRERLNAILDSIHAEGLYAIVNAWNPEDIFTSFKKNPAHLQRGDSYLLESYIFSSVNLPFQHYRHRISVCDEARKNLGISIYGVTVTQKEPTDFSEKKWEYLVLSGHVDQIDGVAWSENDFSSRNSLLTIPSNNFLSVDIKEDGKNPIDVKGEIITKSFIVSDEMRSVSLLYKDREIKENRSKIKSDLVECPDTM